VERWRETSVSTHADAPGAFLASQSERIKVLSLNRMDDLSSHSKVVHRALCRHWNGATVKTHTGTIVAFIRG
jgi:hypothetical protein